MSSFRMLPIHFVDTKQIILRLAKCWSVELFQDLFNNPLEHNPDPPPTVCEEISFMRCRRFLFQQYACAFLELWLKKTNSTSLSGRWTGFKSTPICGFYTFLSNTCEPVTLSCWKGSGKNPRLCLGPKWKAHSNGAMPNWKLSKMTRFLKIPSPRYKGFTTCSNWDTKTEPCRAYEVKCKVSVNPY